MKAEDYKNLMQGVKELKAYRLGKLKASRVIDVRISSFDVNQRDPHQPPQTIDSDPT